MPQQRSLVRKRRENDTPSDVTFASTSATPLAVGRQTRTTPITRSIAKHQIVLQEEEYVAALSYLIRRDFFPDNDAVGVAVDEDGVELSDAYLPDKIVEYLGPQAAEALTIGSFQANFTSEDNASFQDILENEKRRRRKAYGWAYDAEKEGKGRAKNALYYAPPALEAGSQADRLLTAAGTTAKRETSKGGQVNYKRTRIGQDEEETSGSQLGSMSPRSSRIDAAIDGAGSVSDFSGIDDEENNKSSSRYGYVKPVGSPRFQNLTRKQQSQMMTWGKIAGTPKAVQNDDLESMFDGRFRIPPTPKRDVLARSLASGKSHASSSSTSSPRFHPSTPGRRTPADLTPAARSLLDRTSRRKG